MTFQGGPSDQQVPVPAEEPDVEACVGMAYYLLPSSRDATVNTDWVYKVTLLLSDYGRRSEAIALDLQERLHRVVIQTFGPTAERLNVSDLASHLPSKRAVDVAIVTILPEELKATLRAFGLKHEPQEGQPFFHATVPCHGRPGRDLSLVITAAPKPLNVHIGAPVARLRSQYSPAAVFLVGIAGGRKGRARHGDVVIAQRVFYFAPGRVTADGSAPRPQVAEPHNAYGNGLYSYDPAETGLFDRVATFIESLPPQQRPASMRKGFMPTFHRANTTVAAGESVFRDGKLLEQMAQRHDDTIRAVDQESYGFADAVRELPWAVFRGISDIANSRQDDRWKYVSAGIAALCLRDFLENGFVPPDVAEL